MPARRLVLFELDGVLVETGELRRTTGAAEVLAQLRGTSDAVLSLVTADTKDEAQRKTAAAGVDRYLDLEVGTYATDTDDRAKAVALSRRKAKEQYGGEFTATVVTTSSTPDVSQLRPEAETVIAVASESEATEPHTVGVDHVVTRLVDAVEPARG